MRFLALILLASIALTAAGAAIASSERPEWPQYRGPERTGRGAPGLEWSESVPHLLWKRKIGPSFATVVSRGDRLYTAYSDDTGEYLACLDAATGEERWKTPVGEVFASEFGNGPRATPTLDGDRVVLLGGKGRLVSARADDGAVVWQVELTERFGVTVPRFGFSGSALVVGDALLVEVGDGETAGLALLDRATGETRSRLMDGSAGYSSPMIARLAGREQILMIRGNKLLGFDADGSVLWSHEVEGGVIAMPVPIGDDRVFISAADDTGCALVRIEKEGDAWKAVEVWKNRNMRNHFNSSILVDGVIYGFDNATLKALDATTGEMLWGKRGLGKGSLAASGDLLAVLTDKGELKFLRANRESYRELGALQAIEGKSWTSPSIVGNRIFVRNLEQIACVELGG